MWEAVYRSLTKFDLELLMYGVLFLFFLAETALDRRVRPTSASLRESLSSLAMTVLHNFGKYVFIPPLVKIYSFLFAFRPLELPWSWWGVGLALIAVDFTYYVHHRSMHRLGLFWTVHAVHHQPKFVNLSMSTRLSFFNKALTYWFYLPLALVGVPLPMLALVGLINGFYQAVTHSRHFRLPAVLRSVLIDSRDHHLHHSKDEQVFNLNFGGMLSVWDRLFKTYAPDEVKGTFDQRFAAATIEYGLPGEIGESRVIENPILSNLIPFRYLWRDVKAIGLLGLVVPPGASSRISQK